MNKRSVIQNAVKGGSIYFASYWISLFRVLTTVTVKIPEINRVSTSDYKKLFEQYFPSDFEKLKEFRVKETEKFRLEQSRREGQSALLENWKQEAQDAIYQMDAPVKVFENERLTVDEIEKIKKTQIECRRANEIKNTVLLKYEEKLRQEFTKDNRTFSDEDLRKAVERAFTPKKSSILSPEQKVIFDRAQAKILSSDFERFTENTGRLEKGIAVINQSFETIAQLRSENAQYEIAPEKAHQSSLRRASKTEIADAFAVADTKCEQLGEALKIEKESRTLPEHKPITLIIYERELFRNERLITQAKISNLIENGKLSLIDLETKKASEIFSAKEGDEIRLEAGERTRENLEPKELWAKHQEISEKMQQTALKTSEALEEAHEIYHDAGANPKEVLQAFSALDARIIRLKNERRSEKATAKFVNFKTDFKRDLAQMFDSRKPVESSELLTAMTKGLLIDALEKQDVQLEKIGLGSEKLSEISRTITLALADDKKREKLFEVNSQSTTSPIQESHSLQRNNVEKKPVSIKDRIPIHAR